jgi:hypothetical protein
VITVTLTPAGRVWAERHAATSIVANVALFGDGWPPAFVSASREIANEEGAAAMKAVA